MRVGRLEARRASCALPVRRCDREGVSAPPRREAAPLRHPDVRGRRPPARRRHATPPVAGSATASLPARSAPPHARPRAPPAPPRRGGHALPGPRCGAPTHTEIAQVISGHCRYATALHGQCRGRTASQHQHSRDSQALHSGESVRELLTHSDNDPLQEIGLCEAVQEVSGMPGVVEVPMPRRDTIIMIKACLCISRIVE